MSPSQGHHIQSIKYNHHAGTLTGPIVRRRDELPGIKPAPICQLAVGNAAGQEGTILRRVRSMVGYCVTSRRPTRTCQAQTEQTGKDEAHTRAMLSPTQRSVGKSVSCVGHAAWLAKLSAVHP